MSNSLHKQKQRGITPDHFVIKRTAEPFIWNVYIVVEHRSDGYTFCNFLCPTMQDMDKLKKESFTKGFLVRTDELIPSYMVELYAINPAYELDLMLQKGIQPDQLPERLQPFYEFYSQQAALMEQEQPENSPESDQNNDFTADSGDSISENYTTENHRKPQYTTENHNTPQKTTENNFIENLEQEGENG